MDMDRSDLVDLTTDPTSFLSVADPRLRRMAVSALGPEDARTHAPTLFALAADDDVPVRAAVAEALGLLGQDALDSLGRLADDDDETVREAVATAFGEVGDASAIPWLATAAATDESRHVMEAAVAAMGAIGDDAAVDALLDIVATGPPQVRRRAIAAITVFDDPRVEPAIRKAALDRNPGVREAAEMVVGRQIVPAGD
ncbi:MAG: HEAT repeat domain-containing protein [Acidimicrobiia bacterium]|nr:HEAT repeat domain-containing protein [Acidimicrobiia bacterium]